MKLKIGDIVIYKDVAYSHLVYEVVSIDYDGSFILKEIGDEHPNKYKFYPNMAKLMRVLTPLEVAIYS